tara:strand:- start:50 stop:592 length:543 start_codon:yes stop_codon:yes gene_type:complete
MHNKFPNKYYFINKFDTNDIVKQDTNTAFIYRNYNSKNNLNTIIKIKNFCKKEKYKFFLSNDINLAIKLNLDGAYIPSFNKDKKHLSFSFKKNFLMIGSAHNNNEIKIKESQNVRILFLSSLFKKNKNYLGINRFKLLLKLTDKKVIALGGISSVNLKKLKLINCFGFAGISFFNKKKAP